MHLFLDGHILENDLELRTFVSATNANTEKGEHMTSKTAKAAAPIGENAFPTTGLVRLSQILAPHGPIPVSRSAFWLAVKEGRFPAPIKLGPRTTCWRAEDIRALFGDRGQGGL